jgi:hypothetical protein
MWMTVNWIIIKLYKMNPELSYNRIVDELELNSNGIVGELQLS